MDPRGPALLSDFVLDASAALVLVVDDEPEGPVMPIVHALAAGDPVAPTLWPYEVASALMVAEPVGSATRNSPAASIRCPPSAARWTMSR